MLDLTRLRACNLVFRGREKLGIRRGFSSTCRPPPTTAAARPRSSSAPSPLSYRVVGAKRRAPRAGMRPNAWRSLPRSFQTHGSEQPRSSPKGRLTGFDWPAFGATVSFLRKRSWSSFSRVEASKDSSATSSMIRASLPRSAPGHRFFRERPSSRGKSSTGKPISQSERSSDEPRRTPTSEVDTLTGEAADRLAIRGLVDAWAHGADRRMREEQAVLFTAEGTVIVHMGDPASSEPVQRLRGRAES